MTDPSGRLGLVFGCSFIHVSFFVDFCCFPMHELVSKCVFIPRCVRRRLVFDIEKCSMLKTMNFKFTRKRNDFDKNSKKIDLLAVHIS